MHKTPYLYLSCLCDTEKKPNQNRTEFKIDQTHNYFITLLTWELTGIIVTIIMVFLRKWCFYVYFKFSLKYINIYSVVEFKVKKGKC